MLLSIWKVPKLGLLTDTLNLDSCIRGVCHCASVEFLNITVGILTKLWSLTIEIGIELRIDIAPGELNFVFFN